MELDKQQKKIANFIDFIADGKVSPSISDALQKAEEKKQNLEEKLENLKAREPQNQLMTPQKIKPILVNLKEILSQDIPRANDFFKKLFPTPVTMTPKQNGRSFYYEAAGSLNLANLSEFAIPDISVPNGVRTRVCAVRGRRPGPLDDGDEQAKQAPSILHFPMLPIPRNTAKDHMYHLSFPGQSIFTQTGSRRRLFQFFDKPY